MNNKQAKRIRKAVREAYPEAKPVAYRFHKFERNYHVIKGKGITTVTIPHKHVWMDFACQRVLAKKAKKNFKLTGKIEV
jgi:hypothetical protein